MNLCEEREFIADVEVERTFRQTHRANRRHPQVNRMKNPPGPNPKRQNENPPHARGVVNLILMVDDRNRAIRDYADPTYMSFEGPSLGPTLTSR